MLIDDKIYHIREESGIWARKDYEGILYSDGDSQENLLYEIVKSCTDLSVNSSELQAQCVDWVTTYHFSSLRSNLLRPIESLFLPGEKVLEIGAGCGAITRFIGEMGAEIVALEGSLRRAKIARKRTSDLANVTVVSERFDDFVCEEKFDVITLIGVLEYSNLFSQGADSAVCMLNKIKEKLKPNGKLLIAIENQLGLKYFAGSREDHIGQVMYGVEGRYTKEQAETFGHHILLEKLRAVDLHAVQTLLPFPDYKLPISIVTEAGANSTKFDASVFASQSVRADLQLPESLYFIPELAWQVVFNNKLAVDLSNSFLLVASCSPEEVFDKNLLAVHYGGQRLKPFRKVTTFNYTDDEQVTVKRKLLSDAEVGQVPYSLSIDFKLDGYETYIKGTSLSTEFIKIVTTPGWSMEYVAGYFRYYLECLEIALRGEGIIFDEFTQHSSLPPDYLDAIPSNFLIDDEGQPRYFEREWLAKDGLTVGQLLFRSVLSLLGKTSCFAIPESNPYMTRGEFIKELYSMLSFTADESQFAEYMVLESALYSFSTGSDVHINRSWYPEHTLPGLLGSSNTNSDTHKVQLHVNESNLHIRALEQAKEHAEQLALSRMEEIANLHKAKDDAEKLAFGRLDEVSALYQAKENAEKCMKIQLEEIKKLEDQLQSINSGILGKLSKFIRGNRD
ncbi:class I SAM-dependent methyltransferase [Rahnella selenatireducens]|uniref:class I SAM-dependent methyltransferase n=1 Tax=Rahnella selenatireducens TaxID=3389797 RepID=UPI003969235D